MPSGTPSASLSTGQPVASTCAPAGVPGHLSIPSGTPSRSESMGQPFESTAAPAGVSRSEEHTSELQSQSNLVCRLLLEKKKKKTILQKHCFMKMSATDEIRHNVCTR